MTTFVVPVKFHHEMPFPEQCINSIRKHHPDATIVVVDSASDLAAYLSRLDVDVIADWGNTGYPPAAYLWAWEHTVDDDWAFIHDSLTLTAPIPKPDPLLTVRHFNTPPTGWGWDQQNRPLEEWALARFGHLFPIPSQFVGILGPMWFCTSQVMEDLVRLGVFDVPVTNKWELCAMERVIGIALQHLGYDPSVSLQGEMHGFFDTYDERIVAKCHPGRF